MKTKVKNMSDNLSDDHIMRSIQSSAEDTVAFSATSKWGYEKVMASVKSRGDTFDRNAGVAFEEEGCEILRVPVASMPATVGSGGMADYILKRTGISRLHCHLEFVGNLIRIHDDASTNGVVLNKKKVDCEDLCDGDEVMLGTVSLRIRKV